MFTIYDEKIYRENILLRHSTYDDCSNFHTQNEIKAKRFLLKFHEFTNNKFETSIKWKVHSLQLGIRDSLKNTKS